MSGILHPRLPCVRASTDDDFDDEPTSKTLLPRRDDFVHASMPDEDDDDDDFEPDRNAWSRMRLVRMSH